MKTISMDYAEYKKDLEDRENGGVTLGIYTAMNLLTEDFEFNAFSKKYPFLKENDLRYLKKIYDHFHKEVEV